MCIQIGTEMGSMAAVRPCSVESPRQRTGSLLDSGRRDKQAGPD